MYFCALIAPSGARSMALERAQPTAAMSPCHARRPLAPVRSQDHATPWRLAWHRPAHRSRQAALTRHGAARISPPHPASSARCDWTWHRAFAIGCRSRAATTAAARSGQSAGISHPRLPAAPPDVLRVPSAWPVRQIAHPRAGPRNCSGAHDHRAGRRSGERSVVTTQTTSSWRPDKRSRSCNHSVDTRR